MTHVITMSDAEEKVRGWLSSVATLGGPFDEDEEDACFPVDFATDDNMVDCTAVLYERFNGAVILRLDAEIGDFRDTERLHKWALATPGNLPFVQIRYERVHGTGFAKVIATHSLLVDTLTEESLAQVVSSFDFIVPKWTEKLRALDSASADCGTTGHAGCGTGCSVATGGYCDDFEDFINRDGSPVADSSDTSLSADPSVTPGGVDAVLKELNGLVGLAPVKELVGNLADVQRVAGLRELAGKKALRPSPHLVFTGNPGTGKTTVARLVGRLYKEMGLLRRGHVVETGRHGLVGGYVGQTALKTQEVLESAKDGVLFIDEAYSLAVDHHLDYGREAIETILAYMENNRGRIALVVAGYPDRMDTFLESNPGLASRFDCTVAFPDFSDHELLQIFEGLAAEYDYRLTDAARAKVLAHVATWDRCGSFPNGRGIRKLFNETVVRHSSAAVACGPAFGDALELISAEHVPLVEEHDEGPTTVVGYL